MIAAAACVAHVVIFRDRVNLELPFLLRIPVAVAALAIILVLHEAIHWVMMRAFGLKDARIEFARDPLGIPSLRTIATGQVTGIKRIAVLLAPFLCLTVIPDVILLAAGGQTEFILFVAVMCNAAGSCFDIMDAVDAIH